MENTNLMNADDYGLSFSEEVNADINEKIKAVFADSETSEMKVFAANVLIGNTPAKKVNENVGKTFEMCGYYVKDVKFKDNDKIGKYTILFGHSSDSPCAFATSSDKVYKALMNIVAVYGEPLLWTKPIKIKIRMNTIDNSSGSKAYSLEVLN